MYISGSIKRKIIDKNREKTWAFENNAIYFGNVELNYYGNLDFPIFDKDLEKQTEKKITKLILIGTQKILNIIKDLDNPSLSYYVNEILKILDNMPYCYSYTLYELLYQILMSPINIQKIFNLLQFVCYISKLNNPLLANPSLNQIELEIMINLFRNDESYDLNNIEKTKEKYYPLSSRKIYSNLSPRLQEVIDLGMFINPIRVGNLGNNINNDEKSIDILPIYFLTKDEEKAINFLNECQNSHINNFQDIEKCAKKCLIHPSLIKRF